MWALFIAGLASLVYLTLLFCLKIGVNKLGQSTDPEPVGEIAVSIIIAARNEASNLSKFLPSILTQDYGAYEVLIVLDRCSDNSLEIVKHFAATYPQLRFIEIRELSGDWSGKKFAIKEGIAAARHQNLLFTDADCEAQAEWVSRMATSFKQGNQIVLGVGKYFKDKGFLNLFVRFETFYVAFQYLGWAGLGKAYMGVGRNLAYSKEVFEKNKGFSGFRDSLSGDDDLFINAYAKYHELGAVLDERAFTYSVAKKSWKEWFEQKNRHLSASHKYSWKSRLRLGIFHLSHMISYIGVFLAMMIGVPMTLTLSLLIGRIGISLYILKKEIRQFGDKEILYTFMALDLFFFLYNLFIIPIGLIRKPSWIK
ncbi:MAG: glycosyltransferase [Bacteroidia bacterium]|nr:glycosyltransferase [Bacteroidia bacterium]